MFRQADLPDFGGAFKALGILACVGVIGIIIAGFCSVIWLINHVHIN